MICRYVQPNVTHARSDAVANGEYLIRLLGHGTSRHSSASETAVAAEILEGRHDGRRITFDLAPSVANGFASLRDLAYLAARGACCMAKVAVRTDYEGHRMNVITSLDFLGYESSGLNDYDMN